MAENNSSAPLKTADLPLAVRTAPERIWLDVGFEEAEHINFADLEVTWSDDNATGHGIAYVRADTQAVAAQAPAAVAVPAVDQYLCQAWGETDFPAVAIVGGLDAVRQFLIDHWLGSADHQADDGTHMLEEAMTGMQEEWQLEGKAWKWEAQFEIGGVSVQRVDNFTPALPATEDSSAGDLAAVQAEPVALQMCSELQPRTDSEKAAYLAGVADGRMYAERDAAKATAHALRNRATDLHEKAFMPWNQAEELALNEAGIDNVAIDELIGNCGSTGLSSVLCTEDELRTFTRSVLVHQPAVTAPQAQPADALDADGEADVGNVHANIRALKAQLSARQAAQLIIERRECTVDFVKEILAEAADELRKTAAPEDYEIEDRKGYAKDLDAIATMLSAAPPPAERAPKCWCETCRPITLSDMRMVLCPDCGNKRCPKANHHDNTCTNSNAPGQPGSSWEHVKPHGANDAR